ncbi:HAD-IIA family hydrolase [Rhodococcoides kyotonense]|uniref:Haloacid Dehalogenase Superfamily Class (Subfamily) IIA n=1 Tax=Rhodococcoides kyotonense TaxID=398843 RepID=A0A239MWN1_9NOCA|nr:HAD-IIA family hydrolase [Rhodococcus kyotonensis]SNT47116.1 Haloacid Dehalogenase Superfamily Class (subfamily) IIA [Rhodococcus kyotonensis]
MTTLRSAYDVLLLDLDGTVYQGEDPIVGAVEALKGGSEKQYFVTNNASRSPEHVAAHLRRLGFDTSEEFVVTSAQVAARMLAEKLTPGASVVVVGTEALVDEISNVGLTPVRSAEGSPAAVVQGHNVDTGWKALAEAAFAIRAGAIWVATNIDATLPVERGLAPGNGSMVAAVRHATGAEPDVAGKPAAPIMRDAIRLSSASAPLVVGDRLDTDIAGANTTGIPSLLVLSGVSSAVDALRAIESERPTHIGFDLDVLNQPADVSSVGAKPGWSATVGAGVLTVAHDGSTPVVALDGLLTAASVGWASTGWETIEVVGSGVDELRDLLEAR